MDKNKKAILAQRVKVVLRQEKVPVKLRFLY